MKHPLTNQNLLRGQIKLCHIRRQPDVTSPTGYSWLLNQNVKNWKSQDYTQFVKVHKTSTRIEITYRSKKLFSHITVARYKWDINAGLHSCNTIVAIARDVKPSARIDKCWIPTLKNIVRISQIALQSIQGITCLRINITIAFKHELIADFKLYINSTTSLITKATIYTRVQPLG